MVLFLGVRGEGSQRLELLATFLADVDLGYV
jgi:hypothetical protein